MNRRVDGGHRQVLQRLSRHHFPAGGPSCRPCPIGSRRDLARLIYRQFCVPPQLAARRRVRCGRGHCGFNDGKDDAAAPTQAAEVTVRRFLSGHRVSRRRRVKHTGMWINEGVIARIDNPQPDARLIYMPISKRGSILVPIMTFTFQVRDPGRLLFSINSPDTSRPSRLGLLQSCS